MRSKFLNILFLFTPSFLLAEEDFVLIDRRSFINQPSRACSIIKSQGSILGSSCSSIGFETNTTTEGTDGRTEYIFFLRYPNLKDFKTVLNNDSYLTVAYFDGQKMIALTPFTKINQENILSIKNLAEDELKLHISELESEFNNLADEYAKEEENLQNKISEVSNNPEINEKLELRAEIKSKLQRNDFISKEIKFMQAINTDARKKLGNNPPSPLKAQLSTLLKNSIENDLKTKN